MKYYNRGHHIDNLYDEIRVIREQLLNRIEMLEEDVDYLMEENKYYSKEIYQLQSDINSLLANITRRRTNEGLEFKEGSKEVNKKSKETP
jgi:hypothetical protein|tara:strand:- start:289 stop:558 length:270 start_codon:yes stop_codon:yes gene_type:complete